MEKIPTPTSLSEKWPNMEIYGKPGEWHVWYRGKGIGRAYIYNAPMRLESLVKTILQREARAVSAGGDKNGG